MHNYYKHFTIGIEEEYMVLDPQTRELKSHEQKIVNEGQKILKDKVKAEMHQAVVEVGTDICYDIDEAHRDITTFYAPLYRKLQIVWVFGWALPAHILSAIGKAS